MQKVYTFTKEEAAKLGGRKTEVVQVSLNNGTLELEDGTVIDGYWGTYSDGSMRFFPAKEN